MSQTVISQYGADASSRVIIFTDRLTVDAMRPVAGNLRRVLDYISG
jgi:hypothetical protein